MWGTAQDGTAPAVEAFGAHPARTELGVASARLDVQLRRDLEPLTRRASDLVRAVAARADVEQAEAMVAVAALGLTDKAARRASVTKCVSWLESAAGDASAL